MMINNNYNNNISFGVRYDLSDKANMFSFSQKRVIKKLVNKLGKYDVVCIGTQKVKNLNVDNTTFYSYGARIDSLVGGKQESYRMYDRNFFSELDYLYPELANHKVNEKNFYAACFDWVKGELQEFEKLKNNKSSTKPSYFKDTVNDLKTEVREWSHRKKSFNNDSVLEKICSFVETLKKSL